MSYISLPCRIPVEELHDCLDLCFACCLMHDKHIKDVGAMPQKGVLKCQLSIDQTRFFIFRRSSWVVEMHRDREVCLHHTCKQPITVTTNKFPQIPGSLRFLGWAWVGCVNLGFLTGFTGLTGSISPGRQRPQDSLQPGSDGAICQTICCSGFRFIGFSYQGLPPNCKLG